MQAAWPEWPRADLHTHSTASDGSLAPANVVKLATEQGLSVLALTDHDTTAGLAEAATAASEGGLVFVPGIELSTNVAIGELHILGYGIDRNNANLNDTLRDVRESSFVRLERMLHLLATQGINLDPATIVPNRPGDSVGRPHVARALVAAGHAASIADAFDRYLSTGRPAFVQKERLATEQAIELIRSAGGLPVLAHPLSVDGLDSRLTQLVSAGLIGLECYYSEYAVEQQARLAEVADSKGLLVTGGSDFHGEGFDPRRSLGGGNLPAGRISAFLTALRL